MKAVLNSEPEHLQVRGEFNGLFDRVAFSDPAANFDNPGNHAAGIGLHVDIGTLTHR